MDISLTFVEAEGESPGMGQVTVHREDVKALLRKRYGSIEAFQAAHGLVGQQVRDLLRGKSNRALVAVAGEFGVEPDHLSITNEEIPLCGDAVSQVARGPHRLSGAAE